MSIGGNYIFVQGVATVQLSGSCRARVKHARLRGRVGSANEGIHRWRPPCSVVDAPGVAKMRHRVVHPRLHEEQHQ